MVFAHLFTMSNMALFHVKFNFNNKVLWVPPFKILTMAIPEISSTNGALILSPSAHLVLISHSFLGIWAQIYSKT